MSLVGVGLWLTALGAADLLRLSHGAVPRHRTLGGLGLGALVLLGVLLWLRLDLVEVLLLLLALVGLLALWLVSTGVALDPERVESLRARARVAALVAMGAGTAVGLLMVPRVAAPLAWPGWLSATAPARWPPADVLVAVGVVLVQLVTANLAVRLLLDAVGVPATTNEKQLRGGRVLGPMERIFIIGLGAVGALTAAAVVVAAKGLLRFPELQRAQQLRTAELEGPSDVTEYFLIGSFASWLVAFAGVALIYLA